MVELHTLFTEVFREVDVSGYVYADFVEPLIETHYPLTYGYPAARQAMMARAWESESFAAGGTIQFPCFYCGDETLTSRGILYYRAQLPSGKWGSVEVCEPCLRKQHENRAESFAAEERARDKKGRLVPSKVSLSGGMTIGPMG